MSPFVDTAQRLLTLPDEHRALLAEFDFFPVHNLLQVRWYGHLTAAAIVLGCQAGLDLFRNRPAPRRLLSNHHRVSGEWGEAIPWLHYEWLPQVLAMGVQLVAHVLPADGHGLLKNSPGGIEFMQALRIDFLAKNFRHEVPAWHWATTR